MFLFREFIKLTILYHNLQEESLNFLKEVKVIIILIIKKKNNDKVLMKMFYFIYLLSLSKGESSKFIIRGIVGPNKSVSSSPICFSGYCDFMPRAKFTERKSNIYLVYIYLNCSIFIIVNIYI